MIFRSSCSNVSFNLGFPDSEKCLHSTHGKTCNYYCHSLSDLSLNDDNFLTKYQKKYNTLYVNPSSSKSSEELGNGGSSSASSRKRRQAEAKRKLDSRPKEERKSITVRTGRSSSLGSYMKEKSGTSLEEKVDLIHSMIEDIYLEIGDIKEELGYQAEESNQLKVNEDKSLKLRGRFKNLAKLTNSTFYCFILDIL